MTLVLGVLAYLTTAVALVAIAVRGREMYRRIKSGQPDPTRSAAKGLRFKNMAIEILGHGKMLKFTGSAIAHWFVMVGFVALAGTLVQAMVQVVKPSFSKRRRECSEALNRLNYASVRNKSGSSRSDGE